MCTNPPDFGNEKFFYQKDQFLSRVKDFSINNPNAEQFLLTGGEPTIHPDFLAILQETRKLLPNTQIKILTNGRTFFYEDFARQVLQIKNLSLAFSFCGHDAKLHDAVTRSPGSFQQAEAGLKNILKNKDKSHHIEIRIVLTKLLLKQNKSVFEFLGKNFTDIDTLVFLFPEIEGTCEQNYKTIVPTYDDALKSDFFANFEKAQKTFPDIRLYHFPLCVVPPGLWPNVWRTMDKNDTTFVQQCARCLYQKSCLGVPVGYKKFFGDKEFGPILRKQKVKKTKNEFNPLN